MKPVETFLQMDASELPQRLQELKKAGTKILARYGLPDGGVCLRVLAKQKRKSRRPANEGEVT